MKNLNDIFSDVDSAFSNAKHGNLEEVLSKTKNYAEHATKKSAERLEISKKKIELLDAKSKLSKAYEAFGKLQYAAYVGDEVSKEEIEAKIQEIQLIKSRADLLDAEITTLRDAFVESISKKEARREAKDDIEVEVVSSDE